MISPHQKVLLSSSAMHASKLVFSFEASKYIAIPLRFRVRYSKLSSWSRPTTPFIISSEMRRTNETKGEPTNIIK
jgi:hypothetical protein